MKGTCTLTRVVSCSGEDLKKLAIVHFTPLRYEIVNESAAEIELKYERGTIWTFDASLHNHSVIVSTNGMTVTAMYKLPWGYFMIGNDDEKIEARILGPFLDAVEARDASPAVPTPPVAAQSAEPGPEPSARREVIKEKIIERQVMVTRCKFCGQITALDLNNCDKCGAASFS